jgi:hypothetical protein
MFRLFFMRCACGVRRRDGTVHILRAIVTGLDAEKSQIMKSTLSVGRAILIGLLVVNGPVFTLLFGPLFVFVQLEDKGIVGRSYNWVGLVVIVVSFVLAWLWWSVSVPRWRRWAYERVKDIRLLKQRAVAAGLTWRDGHVFGKTEIKSQTTLKREREVEALASLKRALSGTPPLQLRQASVEVDMGANLIHVRFEYDGEPEVEAREFCEMVAAEVISDFVAPWKIDEQHRAAAGPAPLVPLRYVAYTRADGDLVQN